MPCAWTSASSPASSSTRSRTCVAMALGQRSELVTNAHVCSFRGHSIVHVLFGESQTGGAYFRHYARRHARNGGEAGTSPASPLRQGIGRLRRPSLCCRPRASRCRCKRPGQSQSKGKHVDERRESNKEKTDKRWSEFKERPDVVRCTHPLSPLS
jgi:hypothetical protein